MKYLIWSNEHVCFWAPGQAGYTDDIQKAGRYSRKQAIEICHEEYPTIHRNSRNRKVPPDEVMIVAPESVAELACLRAENERLREALRGLLKDYVQHGDNAYCSIGIEDELVNVASSVLSHTEQKPETCVWTELENRRLIGCGGDRYGSNMRGATVCPGCGKKVEVKS